jgi:hypothetical protein
MRAAMRGCAAYAFSRSLRRTSRSTAAAADSARSAKETRARAAAASAAVLRQTQRNASPTFLFGAPPVATAAPCTIAAIVFTKAMTSSSRHSVASVKRRTSQKANAPRTRRPGIMGSNGLLESARLAEMMSRPASPRLDLSRLPTLSSVKMT